MADSNSFWATLPGILTGIAGVITAIGGLLVILYSTEIIPPKPNGNLNEIEQRRAHLEERINEMGHQIDSLMSEIESLRPEAEHGPDAEMAIREKEGRVGDLEREKQRLQEELRQLPHR